MKKLILVICTVFVFGINNANSQSLKSAVVSIHELELREGIDIEEFEAFVHKTLIPLYDAVEGQEMELVKGDRGKRIGKYAFFLIFNSVESRNRTYPPEGGISKEFQEILNGKDEIWEILGSYVEGNPFGNHTDYVTIPLK